MIVSESVIDLIIIFLDLGSVHICDFIFVKISRRFYAHLSLFVSLEMVACITCKEKDSRCVDFYR
jgi:hypothetical protein